MQGRGLRIEVTMAAIARALSRAFLTVNEMDVLKQLVLFAAAGLLVSLLILTYGVDLSPGFL
jgi:ribose/xylose/arabinose/galactoside ABC-type transport system permease subunit